jgi:ATP-dependent DNA ligase
MERSLSAHHRRLRNRNSSFVLDGEAVLLGIDGRSDFDGLHSRKHDQESSSTPSRSS